jgi:hypothetical protein
MQRAKGGVMKSGSDWTRATWIVVGLALAALASVPVTAATDQPVRFEVPGPFRVGNQGFEAGEISVHNISTYTPSMSLLEVWVNGECLGLLTAHRSVSDVPPVRTEALFHRDEDGRLEMIGFQMTGRSNGTTYRFP